jgi:hypothetical protein
MSRVMSRIARIIPVAIIAAVTGLGVPASAAPGHTVTFTEHQHGTFVEPELNANPCTGDPLMTPGTPSVPGVEFTGNAVEHVTFFPASDEVWATFTETGSVAALGASGTTYRGHATVWGNFNLNQRNSNQTFTATFRVNGSDGTSFTGHETMHVTYNGNGNITVTFDNIRLTC